MLAPNLDTLRLFAHVLAAAIWVGGQFVLAGVVPGLRKVGPEATSAAANGFARVAWPAFAVAFVTGIWNMLSLDGTVSSAYNATLGIKVLLVVVAGFSAFFHAKTESRAAKAATGAIGAVVGLLILFLGVLLMNHG